MIHDKYVHTYVEEGQIVYSNMAVVIRILTDFSFHTFW